MAEVDAVDLVVEENERLDSDQDEIDDEAWEELKNMADLEVEDVSDKRQSVFDNDEITELVRLDSGDLSVESAINMDIVTACRAGDALIVRKCLAKPNADVNETDILSGETPLSATASVGNTPLLEMLLTEFNASVDERSDNTGWTALHASAYHMRSKCLNRLIAAGAEVNSGDCDGRTPLALVFERVEHKRKKGYRRCVQYLQEAGGTLTPTSAPVATVDSESDAGDVVTMEAGDEVEKPVQPAVQKSNGNEGPTESDVNPKGCCIMM